jgi:hypothetical protein
MVKYFSKWNLKCNFNKTKSTVLKKQETKKQGKLVYVWSKAGGSKTVIYDGVKPQSSGEWRSHRESIKVKGTRIKRK